MKKNVQTVAVMVVTLLIWVTMLLVNHAPIVCIKEVKRMKERKKEGQVVIQNVTIKYKTGNAFKCRMEELYVRGLMESMADSTNNETCYITLADDSKYYVRPNDIQHLEVSFHCFRG